MYRRKSLYYGVAFGLSLVGVMFGTKVYAEEKRIHHSLHPKTYV